MLFNNSKCRIISDHDLTLIAEDIANVLQNDFGFDNEKIAVFYEKLKERFECSMYMRRDVIPPVTIRSLTGNEILDIFTQQNRIEGENL